MKVERSMQDVDLQIIDEFYTNGFNGYKAVQAILPDKTRSAASHYWYRLNQKKDVQKAIAEKRARLRAMADIEQEQILRELLQWVYSDATDFITLKPEEIKELPADVRRCIQSFKHKKKTYFDKSIGTQVTEEYIELRLVDKATAIKEINKHIGFYGADNKQNKTTINIDNVDSMSLNNLLQVYNEGKES